MLYNFSILLTLFCISQGQEYDSHSHQRSKYFRGMSPKDEGVNVNVFARECSYDRQCDEDYGYVCRSGKCSCKFGRPDASDNFKCKVEVKLGDFCQELDSRKRKRKGPLVYVRRKCPHFSECSEIDGTCVCSIFFKRKGSTCIPVILEAGGKPCRDHFDCMVQRGQQCYNGTCSECAAGQFKNYRPTARWVVPKQECTCFDKFAELNDTHHISHFHPSKKTVKGSCVPPILIGDHCTIPQNCESPLTPQMTCLDGTCQCPPGSKEYRFPDPQMPLPTFCIASINSPCSEDRECHPPTAYCEKRLEVPVCKCKEGYELEEGTGRKGEKRNQFSCVSRFHEETCGKFYPQNDRHHENLRHQRLTCLQGIYECARPREMFWSKDRGKCVSVIGGRCELDLLDMSSCAGISRCWEYKNLGEYRCQCPLSTDERSGNVIPTGFRSHAKKKGDQVFKPSPDRRSCILAE